MSQTTTPQTITINLSHSREANLLESRDELLQIEALDQLEKLIRGILGRIDTFCEKLHGPDRMRVHDVITVNGERGSGKTTFILNARKHMDADLQKNLCFLDILDPTLIETKEHAFISIISLIQRKVQDLLEKNPDRITDKCNEGWRDSLAKLAGGLCLLDGIGKSNLEKDSWEDPHFALEGGIANAQNGKDLERNFHIFINCSLNIIGKKAFVLILDDMDINFSKGWQILELLRKYITTPQIITIISGNYPLFKQLVTINQRKFAGRDRDNKILSGMVEDLTNQYLLKVFKTSNRIDLLTARHFFAMNVEIIFSDGTKKSLQDTLQEIVSIFAGTMGSRHTQDYLQWLCKKSLRELISIIQAYDPNAGLDKNKVWSVFFGALSTTSAQASRLNDNAPMIVANTILESLLDENLLPEGARLYPCFLHSRPNDLAMSFGSYMVEACNNSPLGYFSYWLRIALPTFSHLNNASHTDFHANAKECITHTGILEGERSLNIMRRYISYAWPQYPRGSASFGLYNGTLRLMSAKSDLDRIFLQLNSEETTPKTLKSFAESFEAGKASRMFAATLYDSIKTWHRYIAMLPISINKIGDAGVTHFSIFNIIGAIAHTLESDDLLSQIAGAGPLCQYPAWKNGTPDIQQGTAAEEDVLIEEEIPTGIFNHTSFSAFNAAHKEWRDKAPKGTSPLTLYKAWRRFHYALSNIPSAIPDDQKFAGCILHRWIILFLNSILAEELKANGKSPLESAPVTADKIYQFNRNLRTGIPSATPLHNWISTCPLLYFFIDPSSELFRTTFPDSTYPSYITIQPQQLQISGEAYNTTPFENLYEPLNSLVCVGHQVAQITHNRSLPPKLVEIERILYNYGEAKTYLNAEIIHNLARDCFDQINKGRPEDLALRAARTRTTRLVNIKRDKRDN